MSYQDKKRSCQKENEGFFRENAVLTLVEDYEKFQVKMLETLDPANIRNFTDDVIARGSFKIERVPVISDRFVQESGRIYDVEITQGVVG